MLCNNPSGGYAATSLYTREAKIERRERDVALQFARGDSAPLCKGSCHR